MSREKEKRERRERDLLEDTDRVPQGPVHGPPEAWPAFRAADPKTRHDSRAALRRVQRSLDASPQRFGATRTGLVAGRGLTAAGDQAVLQLRRNQRKREEESPDTLLAEAREGVAGAAPDPPGPSVRSRNPGRAIKVG